MHTSGQINFTNQNPSRKTALEEEYKDDVKNQEKLKNLLDTTNNVLYTVSTIFPFKFFPTKIIVEPQKVNIVNEYFILSSETRSVMINDIAEVFLNTDLFFSSITIVDKNFVENKIHINFLPKKKGKIARHIITGLVTATKQEIDLSKINAPDLAEKMRQVGECIT